MTFLAKFNENFGCRICHSIFNYQHGFVVAAIIGAVVAAAAAGYGAYSASEAQAEQNKMAKRNYRMQAEANTAKAEAERAAGQARANQIEYDAKKKQRSFLSRAAAAGVDITSGSLFETEEEFAADVSYAKQLAKYQHATNAWSDDMAAQGAQYQSDLFGFGEKKARSSSGVNAGIAGGSTLATSAAKYYGSSSPSTPGSYGNV